MAKIEHAKGRDSSTGPSGYERLLGNAQLGQLISKCHATVISSGNGLEAILENKVKSKVRDTSGIAIGSINKQMRVFKGIKIDSDGKKHDVGVDVVIVKHGKVKLIELKDGDVFDVKKIAGEVEALKKAKKYLVDSGQFKEEDVSIHFCSFNQESKDQIYRGAKSLIPQGSAMMGSEICELLEIGSYEEVIRERRGEQPANLEYFLTELIKIPAVKQRLRELLR